MAEWVNRLLRSLAPGVVHLSFFFHNSIILSFSITAILNKRFMRQQKVLVITTLREGLTVNIKKIEYCTLCFTCED